jgi:hypothetical protein
MSSHRNLVWVFGLQLFLLGNLLVPAALFAQKHAVTDRALSTSLLAAAVPFPSSSQRAWQDSLHLPERFRMDVGYSRVGIGAAAEPLLIAGLRTDFASSDPESLTAAMTGIRMGVRPTEDATGSRPFAVEGYAGIRTLAHPDRGRLPDMGVDVAVGWSNLGERSHGTLGVRFPFEFVQARSWGRLTFALVPTMAWGHIRVRQCENLGSGDNCGDLGLQLEFGRTRFLMAGGVSAGLNSTGLALSLGTQQLLVTGQEPRLSVGLSWTP